MKIFKRLKVVHKVIILLCMLLCIGGGTYFIYASHLEPDIQLISEDDEVVEYGNPVDLTFEHYITLEDVKEEDQKEIYDHTNISYNVVNEDQKEYPAIGNYEITFEYKETKLTKKIVVQDTTKPVFNEVSEITVPANQENFDYSSQIQATDLSPVEVTFDTSTVDITKTGDYEMTATATDSSGNSETKTITVHIIKVQSGSGATGVVYSGNSKVICIDAGHQGRGNSSTEPNGPGSSTMKAKVTSGTAGCVTGTAESQINLEIAIKLQKILSERGYTVVMCRTSQDVNISNAERATIANNANADVFVRLHCDSSTNSSAQGTMTMAPSTSNPYCASIASKSQALSRCILDETCKSAGSSSRGVSITDTMTGLNWSQVPVTIIEMGFLSNPTEDRLLNSDDYQQKLAEGIANGIDKYLAQ